MRLLKTMALVILIACSAVATAAEVAETAVEGVGGSDFHKNDITYSTEVETPHVKWATKLPGGPVKGFFIPGISHGRDMVELMQRLSLEATTVSIDRDWDVNCWGIGDYYGHTPRGDRDDYVVVHGYVEKDLTGPAEFEVMVIPGINGWSRLPEAARDAILSRVEKGAGLVLIHPFVGDVEGHPMKGDPEVGDKRLWDISPLVDCEDDSVSEKGYPDVNYAAQRSGTWMISDKHFITEGVSFDLLPESTIGGKFYMYRAADDAQVLVKSGDYPVCAVKNYGKGRVVAFAYVNQGFIPADIDPVETKICWNFWEYEYSFLTRAVLWAAGRDSGVSIASLSAQGGDGSTVSMTLDVPSARKAVVEVSGHNQYGQDLGATEMEVALEAGSNVIATPAEALKPGFGWPGGKAIFDVIVKDAATGATLNWGQATFEAPKKAAIQSVRPASEYYRQGDTLSAVVQSSGNLEDVTVRMRITDDLERSVAVLESAARQEKYFTYKLDDYLGKYAFLTVELVDEKGAIIDALSVKQLLVVQTQRRPKEFKALVSFSGARSFLTNVQARLVREGGAATGFTWGGGVNNGLNIPRGSFGIYWYDRGPTTPAGVEERIKQYEEDGDFESLPYLTKKELYARTGDTKFLRRVPCFDDPEDRQTLYDIVNATARSKTGYNLDYYFVGDEGALASYTDHFDYCWGEHSLANFRKWLEGEYGSLEALNAKWRTDYETWDAVVPFTTNQALASGNFAPWADHRTYMEITFAGAYQLVRDAVTAGDPDGHIAVSGTQSAMAYNGCDWYRLDQVIDDFLSYGGGNQWDMHRSFAKPGSMIGYWTGYGSSGLAVQNAIWTAAINNVLHPNIFWMPSYLDPDLTYSNSARDMGTAFKALKFEGVGKLFMEAQRRQDGIALHYSMPSIHAATTTFNHRLRGRENINRNFENNRGAWVNLIKGLGMQFDFVAYAQVEEGKLDSGDYRVMILPMSMALSPEEAAKLRSFVEKGGVLIADAMPGVMDDHCSWVEEGVLNDLFGIKAADSSARGLANPATVTAGEDGNLEIAVAKTPGVTGTAALTDEGAAWGLDAGLLQGLTAVEAEVRADGGKALVKIGDADAAIVNSYGKGKAVYLNLLMDDLSGGRGRRMSEEDAASARSYGRLVGDILAKVGARPVISVTTANGEPITGAEMARYSLGDSYVFAMVKELRGVEGMDGVTYYDDDTLGQVARQAITVNLPERLHVTDVRTGEYLGFTDAVDTSVTVGGALVLGLSPSENAVSLKGPMAADLGAHPEFTISVTKDVPVLVRCHVFGPAGEFLGHYARNVLLEDGSGAFVLPSALSDAPGTYTVKVTDVITGATTEEKIALK